MWKRLWDSIRDPSWQWLYNHKYKGMSLEAQRLALTVDLRRMTEKEESAQLAILLNQAAPGVSGTAGAQETAKGLVLYVQRHHYLSAGAGQVLLPMVGLSFFIIFLLFLALLACLLPDGKVNAIENAMLGLTTVAFFAVLVAGSAGGTKRVLLTSLGRGHPSRSVVGLIFTGFLWPAVGAVLGLMLVEAFQSGFLPMPIQEPANASITGGWDQAQHFVILAAFLGGFTESLINRMVDRIVPSQSSSSGPATPPTG